MKKIVSLSGLQRYAFYFIYRNISKNILSVRSLPCDKSNTCSLSPPSASHRRRLFGHRLYAVLISFLYSRYKNDIRTAPERSAKRRRQWQAARGRDGHAGKEAENVPQAVTFSTALRLIQVKRTPSGPDPPGEKTGRVQEKAPSAY